MECFYDFFGRRIQGGLLDEVHENIGHLMRILGVRPSFVDETETQIYGIIYKIGIYGFEYNEQWQRRPTITVKKLTNRYGKLEFQSELNFVYENYNDISIEFLNNFPIEVKDIRTKGQLEKYFKWEQKHLDEFYKFIGIYAVKSL